MFSNFKKRLGVLTAIAVMAALVPALSVSSASAAASTLVTSAGDKATYSACPTGSAAAAGFTDTTSTDVDCIAMYGITTGVTATTYEPTASIPRYQMALYLTRFMNKAGYTLGSGADQSFTDISGYAADIQTAINQIKQAGVTTGTTATTYSPADNVTREQMAMFIERALAKIAPGTGGNSEDGLTTNISGDPTNLSKYNYTDIDTGVTYEGHNAVVELFHLGVTGETPAVGDTYRPLVDITRAEMATFLTKALAHTNARPAGVTIQVSVPAGFGAFSPALHISHRDASFNAVPGTLIDVFSDTNTLLSDPFTAAGVCQTDNTDIEGGVTECKIAIGDHSTGLTGNADIANPAQSVANSKTRTWYAWTAATGTAYDNDSPQASAASASSTAATQTVVTNSINTKNCNDTVDANEIVAYGETVTFTGQLKTLATAAGGVAVAQALSATTVTEITYQSASLATGFAGDADGEIGGEVVLSTKTTALKTDANGTWTYTTTNADPSASAAVKTDLTITELTFATAVGDDTSIGLVWDDNPAIVCSVTVANNSTDGIGVAVTGVARTASATVYDQYGGVVSGETVTFISGTDTVAADAADPFADSLTRVTNASGVATLGYTDTQTAVGIHTVTATTTTSSKTATATFVRHTGYDGAGTLTTVDAGAVGVDQENDDILVVLINDAANDRLVIRRQIWVGGTMPTDTVTIEQYKYDSADRFDISAAASSMAAFELEVSTNFGVGTYTAGSAGAQIDNLTSAAVVNAVPLAATIQVFNVDTTIGGATS